MIHVIRRLLIFMVTFIPFSGYSTEEIKHRQVLNIESQILGETREIIVHLPDGYNVTGQGFPVLYITDGEVHGTHTAGTLDYLAKSDQIPNMILVAITNPRHLRTRDLTLPKKSEKQVTSGADHFLKFIELEVMPFIQSRFETLDYQALAGTSHGGQFAINAFIKRPGLFDGVIAISPSLYWNNNQLLQLSEQALAKHRLRGRLYLSIANEQATMTKPFYKFVNMLRDEQNNALLVASQTFSQESHNTTVLLGQYHGLKHLFSGWAIPETPQTLADLQRIFEGRTDLLSTPMTIPEDRANGYGQWLVHLKRQKEALALLKWNRDAYPLSIQAHQALIKAYLQFEQIEEAKLALEHALQSLGSLDTEQKRQLQSLIS